MLRSRSSSVKVLSPTEVRRENVDTLFMVWLVSRSTADLLDTALGHAGLTGDDFAIYSMLAAAPGISPTDLARWMAAPPTTVSSYVKRFEARGHITRVSNPQDRRSYQLRLTPAGRRTHKAASALFSPLCSQVTDALADAETEVRETLLQLRTIIDGLRRGAQAQRPTSRLTHNRQPAGPSRSATR
jgi:DNA-binding MarR family transcriptional regulator